MKVFLSYPSDSRDVAEQVYLALAASGHKVFFDRDKLTAGDDYHNRIRAALEDSDALVFLVSSKSVAAGSYALTELKFARQKWPDPHRRVLPVMIEPVNYAQIPNYLRAVTILEPEGNVAAEVLAALEEWRAQLQSRPADNRYKVNSKTSITGAHTGSHTMCVPRQAASGFAGAFGAFLLAAGIVHLQALGFDEISLLVLLFAVLVLALAFVLWRRQSRRS